MSKFAEPMARLIEELKKLPGIGSKSAQRARLSGRADRDSQAGCSGAKPSGGRRATPGAGFSI